MTGKNWAGPNAAGAPTRDDSDVALERANLAIVTANGAAAASTDATARGISNEALGIAIIGTNTGTNAYTLATAGSNTAWAAQVTASTGTNAVAPFVTYGTNYQTIVIVGTESTHTIQILKGLVQSWVKS